MNPRLLILDDDESVALSASAVAEGAGWEAPIVNNSSDAIQRIGEGGADLFLTDYQMSSGNGLRVIEAIRLQGSNIPVILMSSLAREIDPVEIKRLGIVAILKKPFDAEELEAALALCFKFCKTPGETGENSK